MAIALVQKSASVSGTSTGTLPGNSTAGNLLIAHFTGNPSAGPASWVKVISDSNGLSALWYYENNPGGLSSFAFTGGNQCFITEWSGVATSSSLDTSGANTNFATSPLTATTVGNVSAANYLGVGVIGESESKAGVTTLGISAGWTNQGDNGSTSGTLHTLAASQLNPTSGAALSLQGTSSSMNLSTWGISVAVFKIAAAGPSDLTINKSDTITISESVDVARDGARDVNKSDSITVTESIGRLLESNRSISDSITLTENTKVEITSFVSKSDTVTLTENIDLQGATISGTIVPAATEAEIVAGGKTTIITLLGDTWIAAGALSFDLQRQNIINGITSAQSEATGWNLVPQAAQSVNGVVRTSDTVVTITWDAFPTYNITAQETITTTVPGTALTSGLAIIGTPVFTISTVVPTLTVNVSDSVTVSESVSRLLGVTVSVNDTATITESTKIELTSFINKSDSITITENRSLLIPELFSTVSDTVTLTESLKLLLESYVIKHDSVTVTENPDPELVSFVNVSDSITVTELVDPELVSRVSVSDTITVTENAVVSIEAGVADLTVNASDSITLTENLKDELNSFVSKSDTVTITEAINLLIPFLLITSNDTATISESINRLLESFVNVSDTATISESVQIQESTDVNISDSTTISEQVTVVITELYINQSDSITVAESANRLLVSDISKSESITITESVEVFAGGDLSISVSDSIVVSESRRVYIEGTILTQGPNVILLTDGNIAIRLGNNLYMPL